MRISLIAAMDKNSLIGKGSALPWHIPADFKRYKEITNGHPLVMGRKTHESIGRALPGRLNVVVSRDESYTPFPGAITATSLDEALKLFSRGEEVFINGGAMLYKEALDRHLVDKMYLTVIDAEFEGDTFFPEYDASRFREIKREERAPDKENHFHLTFLDLLRN